MTLSPGVSSGAGPLWFAVTLAAVLGCLPASAVGEEPIPQQVVRVAVAPFEPFAFRRDQRWVGLDVDLVNLVCTSRGWLPFYQEYGFFDALQAVETGAVDLAIGAFYITPERRKRFTFSRAYVSTGLVMVGRAEEPLWKKPRRIGVKGGATGEAWAAGRWGGDPGVAITPFPSTEDSFRALVAGEVDVVLNDYLNSGLLIAEQFPGQLVIARRWGYPRLFTRDRLAFPLAPGARTVAAGFDEVLRELERGGTLERLRQVWLHAPLPPHWGRLTAMLVGTLVVLGGVFAAAVTLTSARTRARSLAQQVELLRFQEQMVETAAAWICVTESDGRVVLWNRAAEVLSGCGREEVLGRREIWSSLLPDEEARNKFLARLATVSLWQGFPEGEVVEISPRQGEPVALSLFVSPMGSDGGAGRVVVVGLDVSAERALANQLLQSQKLEAVGRFAAGIAHEFNNLLQVILSHAEALSREAPAHGEARVREVVRSARHGAALTRQILALGRQGQTGLETVDLDALVLEAGPLMQALATEAVRVEIVTEGAGPVAADPVQIQQVLLNLLANARDAMPRGGTARVRTARRSDTCAPGVSDPDIPAGAWAIVQVTDEGAGMSPEVVERAFEPFFTTKPLSRGTGLGLPTVRAIMTSHGGHVRLRSTPGRGTTVTLALPPASRGELRPVRVDDQGAVTGSGLRILLLEDETTVRLALASGLEMFGFDVTPLGGLADLSQWLPGAAPSVLLTDLRLGDGSGIQAAAMVRRCWPGLPVCLLTGYGETGELATASREGDWVNLTKPCPLEDLARVLHRLGSGARSEPAVE